MFDHGPFGAAISVLLALLRIIHAENACEHESHEGVAAKLALSCAAHINVLVVVLAYARVVQRVGHRLAWRPLLLVNVVDLHGIERLPGVIALLRFIVPLPAEYEYLIVEHACAKVEATNFHFAYFCPFGSVRLEDEAIVELADTTAAAHHVKHVLVAHNTPGYELVGHDAAVVPLVLVHVVILDNV